MSELSAHTSEVIFSLVLCVRVELQISNSFLGRVTDTSHSNEKVATGATARATRATGAWILKTHSLL